MKISPKEFTKIAKLARLEFSETEATSLKGSLDTFVQYLDKLKDLDTQDIEPMMRVDEKVQALREDQVAEGLTSQEALQNAPQASQGHFSIPKVVR